MLYSTTLVICVMGFEGKKMTRLTNLEETKYKQPTLESDYMQLAVLTNKSTQQNVFSIRRKTKIKLNQFS